MCMFIKIMIIIIPLSLFFFSKTPIPNIPVIYTWHLHSVINKYTSSYVSRVSEIFMSILLVLLLRNF